MGVGVSISLQCSCGKAYNVPDSYAGRSVKCQRCGNVFKAEAPPEEDFFSPPVEYGVEDVAASAQQDWDPSLQQPSEYDRGSSWVVDQSTQASNSGRMKVDLGMYFSLHPSSLIVEIAAILIGVAVAGGTRKPILLFISAVGFMMLFKTVATVRAKFRSGDVNPAVVISKTLVAVFVDLTKGGGSRPAIKIIAAPISRMTGGPPQVGQYLAAVCLYSDGPGDAWGDVDPAIVQCGVRNKAAIDRVMASISPREWKMLDTYLARVTDRRPGLYRLWRGG